jgi:hypothetical protein
MTITPAAAQTMALQVAGAVLILSFGVLALRVAPSPGASARTAAWFMAGVTFTLEGVLVVIHSVTGVAAFFSPRGSAFFKTFVALAPAGNDARSLLVLGFAAGLVWVLLLGRAAPSPRTIVATLCALILAGFAAGLAEPPLQARGNPNHLGLMSLASAATAVLLFAALYRGMVRGSVDWLLWVALALYAAEEALSSNILTVLTWAGVGGGWAPPIWSMMWGSALAPAAMLACSARRLALARAGIEAPGLIERLRG